MLPFCSCLVGARGCRAASARRLPTAVTGSKFWADQSIGSALAFFHQELSQENLRHLWTWPSAASED